MALITGRDSFGGGQLLSESEWTQLMVEHGYAEFAASDPHRKPERLKAVSQAPAPAPSEGLSGRAREEGKADVSQARPRPASLERRSSLSEMAQRMTGRRRRKL